MLKQENKTYSLNVGSSHPKPQQSRQSSNSKFNYSTTGKQVPSQKHTLEKIRTSRPNSAEILPTRHNLHASSTTSNRERSPSRTRYPDTKHTGGKTSSINSHSLNSYGGRSNSTLALDCWQFLMILANVIIMFGGFAIFILGAWMIFDNTFTGKLIGTNLYLSTVYVLLGCGFFSVVLAVVGCVGAIRAVKCLVLMYLILVVAVFMMMLIAALMTVIGHHWMKKMTEDHMLNLLQSYTTNSIIRDAWDTTQQNLHCCGVHSSEDWPKGGLPGSCCEGNNCKSKGAAYKAGCLEKTEEFMKLHIINLAAAFIGVTLIIVRMHLVFIIWQKNYNK